MRPARSRRSRPTASNRRRQRSDVVLLRQRGRRSCRRGPGKDGTLYVSIGGPGPGTAQFEPAGNADSVVSVDSSGTVTQLANIGQYERDNNPDPNAVDSDVGGMAMGADGLLYVADSGGNDLYSVDPTTGELKLVTVFPGLPSVNGAPNPARGNKPEVDPGSDRRDRRPEWRRLRRLPHRRGAVGDTGRQPRLSTSASGRHDRRTQSPA